MPLLDTFECSGTFQQGRLGRQEDSKRPTSQTDRCLQGQPGSLKNSCVESSLMRFQTMGPGHILSNRAAAQCFLQGGNASFDEPRRPRLHCLLSKEGSACSSGS